jgi:hypothetical protein
VGVWGVVCGDYFSHCFNRRLGGGDMEEIKNGDYTLRCCRPNQITDRANNPP